MRSNKRYLLGLSFFVLSFLLFSCDLDGGGDDKKEKEKPVFPSALVGTYWYNANHGYFTFISDNVLETGVGHNELTKYVGTEINFCRNIQNLAECERAGLLALL